MSVLKTPPVYDSRSVEEWLVMAGRGEVLLPNFQRSFVWQPKQAAAYLLALLENRPTGILLILEATKPLQFESRSLDGTNFREGHSDSATRPRELVLDGQQRLTSLSGALCGTGSKRYLIRVRNLTKADLEVEEVTSRSHKWSKPAKMYEENWIPVDILWNDAAFSGSLDNQPSNADSIKAWCTEAAGDEWDSLYGAVLKMRERLVVKPKLQYCQLRKETSADTAISIFINVNRSAIKLKEVDIAVAIARANHGEDLRARVENYLGRSTEARYYFSPDHSKAIPEVAAWMLKVGCLKVRSDIHRKGLPPKESHYPSAVKCLFGSDLRDQGARAAERESRMSQLETDLDTALRFVAHRGGATKRTLPAWPPVHVVVALQEDVRKVGSALQDQVTGLLSAYVWRAFVTKRYGRQANDRLLEDFRALRRYIEALAETDPANGGAPALDLEVPIFNETRYPLPNAKDLVGHSAGWIGQGSRLGRAIAAVAMAQSPFDWAKGERLGPDRLRTLEIDGKLERRHIFPPTVFETVVGDKIKLGINGVLLIKGTKPLVASDPHALLACVRDHQPDVDELELRRRLDSHLVSYVTLVNDGAASNFRYTRFIEDRAGRVAAKMRELAKH